MDNDKLERPVVIAAAAGTGTAAIIVFAMMPVLVGGMADRYDLDDLQAGLLATTYFSTYAVVALSCPAWIRRWNWRLVTVSGYLIMLGSLGLALLAPGYDAARMAVAASGLGAGLLFPISLTLVSDMEHTERVYAIKLAVEQLVPAALLILLSTGLLVASGVQATLAAILSALLVCLLCSAAMPAAGRRREEARAEVGDGALMGVLALLALAINFAGFAGLWVFMERIAVERGFDSEFINLWLAVGLLTSGVGPVLAALLSDRLGRVPPLLFSTLAALASMTLLGGEVTRWTYALALILLPLTYYFGISYIFSVIASADVSGRIAGLMSFALAVGSAAGPALFGAARRADGPVLGLMAACMAAGALLIIYIASRQSRSAEVPLYDG
jgi:predicted MFS family arabinose efflux permease